MVAKSKNKIKYWAVTVIVLSVLLLVSSFFYEIKLTDSRTDCFPYKAWLVDKTAKDPVVGDFIMFRTPETATQYIPGNKKWIKMILASEGGKIEVVPAAGGETSPVFMGGMQRNLPVRAHITVDYKQNRQTFVAFAADSLGRPLSIVSQQIIPTGHYYLYSPVARSYDSRYWGLVRKNEILGKAYPIF